MMGGWVHGDGAVDVWSIVACVVVGCGSAQWLWCCNGCIGLLMVVWYTYLGGCVRWCQCSEMAVEFVVVLEVVVDFEEQVGGQNDGHFF